VTLLKLSIQEMATVASQWADPTSPAHAVISKYALLKAYLPQIVALNTRLTNVRTVDPTRDSALAALATDADGEHDFWLDAIVNVCDAMHPTQPDLGLQDIRQWLFPRGLLHARDSYGTEVGYALQKASEIDAARKKQLKAIVFGQMTLLQWVDNWLEAAQKLGAIEAQRSQPVSADSNEATAARRAFLGLVKGLEAAAKVAGLSDDELETVFGYVNELSARKATAKKKSVQPPPTPAPTPAPTPEPVPAPVPAPVIKPNGDPHS
jgi:hypothetical protein